MSRRVIPAGDSLKDFHRAGGEPGPNRNRAKDSDPGTRLADSYDILLCEGESLHESFTVSRWGPPLHRLLITISRIPESLNS